jgi:YggT family protein
MQDSLLFLVKTLTDLYILTFLLRFVLQWIRADFYNPFSQFILRATNPLVAPVRRVVPSVGGVDTATLLVLVVLQSIANWMLLAITGRSLPPLLFAREVVLSLVYLTLWMYSIAILVYVVLSWIGQSYGNPIAHILGQLVEPVLRPFRRIIPPIGGLDIAPLLALIIIQALMIAVR